MHAFPPFSVILAAGGSGSRMGTTTPKQYLPLCNKAVALYSFELFLSLSEVQEIVVVCESLYEDLFKQYASRIPVVFARPGKRRQDSIYQGLKKLSMRSLVCVHDAARPFINASIVRRVVQTASEWGAAVVGVPVKGTIKVCDEEQIIKETPNRACLWEMQTPQVIHYDLLEQGYQMVHTNNLTVTDDVSIVELLGQPVKVVEGTYTNIKLTTPEDFILAQELVPLCTVIS